MAILAKQLLPKAERKEGEEFDSRRLIEANSLDADRKVCVEYLKILNRNFAQMGSLEVANHFPRRHLVSILNCTLEMDRAKCRFFNFYKPKGRRGMHWFAKNHIDPKSTRWYKEKWAEYVKADYEGDATISKRLMWLFDEEAFGLQDEKRNRRLHELLEPQKANWGEVEGDLLE